MPTPKIKKEKKVFISHASKDKEIADAFVDIILHGAMSIDLEEIFCISTEGTKIKSGYDWRDSIKGSLISSKATFLIITPNYKESEMCLNEMGAAWVLSGLVLPTIIEPITFKTVGVIPEVSQVEKLLDEGSLDRLRDSVQAALNIPASRIASDRWSIKKREFIRRVQNHIRTNLFPIPIERTKYEAIIAENIRLEKSLDDIIDEKQKLEQEIKELEKAKGATEAKAIKRKYHPTSEFADFIELCKKITSSLRPFKPIVRGIIFKTYNSKPSQFDWQAYKPDIEEADAEDYIDIDDDDGSIEADWHTTRKMKDVYSNLQKLYTFISKTPSDAFYEEYQENFEAPFKIDNKSFWDEAFKLPIYLK